MDAEEVRQGSGTWFSPMAEYIGAGHTLLEGSPHKIEGTVAAQIGDADRGQVKLTSNFPLGLQLLADTVQFAADVDGGTLTAAKPLLISKSVTSSTVPGATSMLLNFDPQRFRFDATGANPAYYWVVPLYNFVADLTKPHPELDAHPLSLHRVPTIPEGSTDAAEAMAVSTSRESNNRVAFTFNGAPAFIERLPDYIERVKRLKAREARHLITAVMVGEISGHSTNPEAWEGWFPYNILHLVGMATGVEVGAPWIEFRDAGGVLVSRVHISLGRPVFDIGQAALGRFDRGEIGALLTQAQASPYYKELVFRTSVRHAIRAGMDRLFLEDRWTHLIRALEGLTTHFNLDQQNLLDGLTPTQQTAIQNVIHNAATQLHTLPVPGAQRDRIANRILGAVQRDKNFGLAVMELLTQFGFPDAKVVEAYYTAQPPPHGRSTFASMLSYYRGAVLHEGAFDLAGAHDREEVSVVLAHLHDLLHRILLQMAGYTGSYEPIMAEWELTRKPLNWVTELTKPEELGYGRTGGTAF